MGQEIADRYNPSRQLKVNEDGTVDTNITNGGVVVSSANPLPVILEELESQVSVNENSQLKTSIFDPETGKGANVETLGSLKTITPIRLVGETFSGNTKDPNFWTETVTGSGTVTQAGEITLSTGTTADSTTKYNTVDRGRKVTGATNQFRFIGRNVTVPQADNVRRVGPYCANDGFFIEWDGVTFGFGSRKGGVDTVVENGSFNGNAGATIDVNDLTFNRVIIEYTSLSAKLFVNGVLIHTITADDTALTENLNLPVTFENNNINGNTTNNEFEILFATILRLGELNTENRTKFINTNRTTVCKYGAGRLVRIVNCDNAGDILIYDGITTGGTLIAEIDTAKVLGDLNIGSSFSDGLTVVTKLGAKALIIYE